MLVDQRGAPLSLHITGANVHDKWLADELIVSIVVPRPDPAMVEQHICLDKGYNFPDVHRFVELERCRVHIKHRRRGEPVVEACPVPGETNIPLAAGSLSVPSVGSPSVTVFGYIGARKPITGWDSFNSLASTFSWT